MHDRWGNTPLGDAVSNRHYGVVEALQDKDARLANPDKVILFMQVRCRSVRLFIDFIRSF
jgi:hypothetical protein